MPGSGLEVAKKPHPVSDSCVADLFRNAHKLKCMLRFFIGLRLALEHALRFCNHFKLHQRK
jgi:hypothetical protein